MFFNYIIYFLIALSIYVGHSPTGRTGSVPAWSWDYILLSYLVFGLVAFRLLRRPMSRSVLAKSETALTGVALALFGWSVYGLGLKSGIHEVPLAAQWESLDGLIGLTFFFAYLIIIWLAAYPAQRRMTDSDLTARSHVAGQLRWTAPLLLPWLLITLVDDLIHHLAPESLDRWLNQPAVDLAFAAGAVVIIAVFLPAIIRRAWRCRPLPTGPQRDQIEQFLAELGVEVREILLWPLMGGRMLTAGVMGIIPRFRYLLITPALLETLPQDELEAVLAHEAGHVRHKHLLLYLAFLGGYMVLALALAGLLWKLMISWTAAADWVAGLNLDGFSLDTVVIMLPMLVWLVVYFRFVFGFFMRNFERQADLFAAALVGAEPLIRAFNRIAAVSGMNPKTPSWHHFSIYRRVRTLTRFSVDPELIKRHAVMLKRSMIAYAGLIALVIIIGWPSGLFSNLGAVSLEKALTELDEFIQTHPGDPAPFLYKAQILLRLDRQKEALAAYNQAIHRDPNNAAALNDSAWIMVAGPKELHDYPTALRRAQKAAAITPDAAILDTLAEACFKNGLIDQAVAVAEAALRADRENRDYYREQLDKFRQARDQRDKRGR